MLTGIFTKNYAKNPEQTKGMVNYNRERKRILFVEDVKPVRFDELTRAVARLTSIPTETAFEARRAELAAILEELTIRQATNAERVDTAKEKYQRAKEKVLRDRAQIAFLAAGGARGEFAREWPSVLLKEVRSVRTSDHATGRKN